MVASAAVVEFSTMVDSLEVATDEVELRVVLAARDRLDAKVAVAVGEFDRAGLWDESGATSMRSWLVDEGVLPAEATQIVRAGDRLQRMPVLRAACVAGDLSRGQLRVVLSAITNRNEGEFAKIEPSLVPALVGLSIAETDRVMTEWRAKADAVTDPDDTPGEPELAFFHSQSIGGRWMSKGAFDTDEGSVVAAALAAADSGDVHVAASRRRAEALVEMARQFLDHHDLDLPARRKPHVNLVVRAEAIDQGHHADHLGVLDSATVARYLCDCSISRVVADSVAGSVSQVLDLGRSTNVVSRAQRTALAIRDRGCRYPGCDRPVAWTDAHHIAHWTHGGSTDLSNLVLLCRRHHTLVHRRHLEVKLRPDGVLEVTDPAGRVRVSRPPGSIPDLE